MKAHKLFLSTISPVLDEKFAPDPDGKYCFFHLSFVDLFFYSSAYSKRIQSSVRVICWICLLWCIGTKMEIYRHALFEHLQIEYEYPLLQSDQLENVILSTKEMSEENEQTESSTDTSLVNKIL